MVILKRGVLIAAIFLFTAFVFNIVLTFGAEDGKIIAYYFHTTARCPSCYNIEKFTRGALNEYYGRELESGKIVFKVVNVEEKGDEHFLNDYGLYTKSVVLSLQKKGKEVRFKNLDQIWQRLQDRQMFYEYIKNETQAFLDELSGE